MIKSISILGCGWLGKPLASSLIKLGYKVKGSTRSENKNSVLKTLGIEPYLIDIESPQINLSKFLESDLLIILITSKNIEAFQNLINEIELSQVGKIIFISSTSVYKKSDSILTEDSELEDNNLVKIENLISKNSSFLSTIIRFSGLIGYNRNPGRFFPDNKVIPNPEGVVNMIHRDDSIGIIESIIKKEIFGEVFNASSDQNPTRRNFYTKTQTDLNREKPIFDESQKPIKTIVSNRKLKSILDYQFKFPDILNIEYTA